MGRPTKQGFDFFPWECGAGGINDRHVDMAMDECGTDAYTLYHFLLDAIYSDKGYYVIRDKALDYSAARKLRVTKERIAEVFECLLNNELIVEIEQDGETFITSKGIQKRFLWIRSQCRRTGEFEMVPNVWMIGEFLPSKSEEIGENTNDAEEIGILPSKSDKEKEKKLKERKVNESKSNKKKDSDFFLDNPFSLSYSESELLQALKEMGAKINSRTPHWVSETLKTYDKESIKEAMLIAYQKKNDGELDGSFVGYVNSILKNWANGIGTPDHVARMEANLKEEKLAYMKPGKTAIPVLK